MKKPIYIISSFLLAAFLISACQPKEAVIDIEKEKAAIIAVIEEERDAFLDGDAATCMATWIQDSNSRKMFMSQDGLTDLNGYEEVYKQLEENIESLASEETEDIMAHFLNYEFKFYNNTALVFCNTKWTGKYKGEEIDGEQKRILHFVKVDGVWKFDLAAMYKIPKEEEKQNQESETE